MTSPEDPWPAVASALAKHWDFPVTGHDRLGGRNAKSWRVSGPAGVAVAKLVEPGDGNLAHFEGSLLVATALDSCALPTAPPRPSRDNRPVVPVGSGRLALLPWLEGRALSGTADADLGRMGAALAALHRRAAGVAIPPAVPAWPWAWLSLETLGLVPVDPGDAVLVDNAGRAALKPGPVGIVHGDPTPENFLLAGPVVAIIDWATVMQGPARYDLAVLVLAAERAGARPGQIARLVAEYDAAGGEVAGTGELARMRALRLAAEIVYFTSRIRNPEPTGADEEEDRTGLERARSALRELTESGLD